MTPSPACFAIINGDEQCRLTSYPDPGSELGKVLLLPVVQRPPRWWTLPGHPWTVGWGSTGADIGPGTTWTQEQADRRRDISVGYAAYWVNRLVTKPLRQCEFDALVSLVYNVGPTEFQSSHMLQKLNAGDVAGAAEEFIGWDHSNGVVLPGLTKRRAQERTLFLSPSAS